MNANSFIYLGPSWWTNIKTSNNPNIEFAIKTIRSISGANLFTGTIIIKYIRIHIWGRL